MSTYSYGRSDTRHHHPTNDLDLAHYQAQRWSALGESWTVHEYPPGDPQPGKLIAAYLNGELVIVGSLTWTALFGPDGKAS